MNPNLAALLYLLSGVLFILALRGLSSPESSRRGNAYGMTGMAIAVATTLGIARPEAWVSWALIGAGIAAGGTAGAIIARRIAMTAMPQLVASFHSLVGLAAVFVAAAALNAPQAFGIGVPGDIYMQSLIEMSIGVAIGAITFSGSVIAFLKLAGRMSGKPILLPARHLINLAKRSRQQVSRPKPKISEFSIDRAAPCSPRGRRDSSSGGSVQRHATAAEVGDRSCLTAVRSCRGRYVVRTVRRSQPGVSGVRRRACRACLRRAVHQPRRADLGHARLQGVLRSTRHVLSRPRVRQGWGRAVGPGAARSHAG